MSDVVAWLVAELSRVEQTARAMPSGPWRWVETEDDGGEHDDLVGADGKTVLSSGDVDGYKSWVWRHDGVDAYLPLVDPAVVLRRVAADRQILAEHASDGDARWPECVRCADGHEFEIGECRTVTVRDEVPWPCRTVLLIAEAYGWEGGQHG